MIWFFTNWLARRQAKPSGARLIKMILEFVPEQYGIIQIMNVKKCKQHVNRKNVNSTYFEIYDIFIQISIENDKEPEHVLPFEERMRCCLQLGHIYNWRSGYNVKLLNLF